MQDYKRYLDPKFETYAREVFEHHVGRTEFDRFLKAFPSDKERAAFFRIAGFYKCLVRDLRYSLTSGNPVPDYIEATHSFLAIVSLIEGTEASVQPTLSATKRFIRFFERLDDKCKRRLSLRVQVKQQGQPLEAVAKYLYALRSEFVHEGKLLVEVRAGPVISTRRMGKAGPREIVATDLPLEILRETFEHGVLLRFSIKGPLAHAVGP